VTESNLIGIGPPKIEIGDQVSILAGAQMPFVLREMPQNYSGQGAYCLVGEAYVHGVMDGSAVEFDDQGEPRWTTIKLV
jgi:hypothetical protein